jgi:hypothetical protein
MDVTGRKRIRPDPQTSPMLRRQNSQRLACSSKIRETLANPEITQGKINKEEILMVRTTGLRIMGLLLGVLFVALLPAAAQDDKVEVFGGYSYMRFRPGNDVNLNGWEASAQYKFRDWIGGVADFDGHYGSQFGVGESVHSFLFGPQVSWPSKVSPFAHVLLGGAHFSAGGVGDTAFSMAIGGGMDYQVNDRFSWRIIQGDYLLTRFFGNTQNNGRLSTGIIYRF